MGDGVNVLGQMDRETMERLSRQPGLRECVELQLRLNGWEYDLWITHPELGFVLRGPGALRQKPYYWCQAYVELFGREYHGGE